MNNEKKIQQEKLIDTATSYINLYLSQKEDEETFCKLYEIDLELFHSFARLVHRTNNELYNLYEQKQRAEKREMFKNEIVLIKEAINLIKTGIEEDGITRRFDMIDFFVYTGLQEKEILNIIPLIELTPTEIRLLKNLIKPQNLEPLSEHEVFTIENSFINENGDSRTITKEEKEEILNYLYEHNIPLLGKTFSCAMHKYIENHLYLEKEKIRKL